MCCASTAHPSGSDRTPRKSRPGRTAMKTYRTQFAALEAGGQRRLTHPAFVRHEVVWIQPAS
jgi:hypothetical protein